MKLPIHRFEFICIALFISLLGCIPVIDINELESSPHPAYQGKTVAEALNSPFSEKLGNKKIDSYPVFLGRSSIQMYRRFLSPSISSGCPCYPSCSNYMELALIKYGLVRGMIIGMERLLREPGEIMHGTVIITDTGPKIYDPIEANTYWWEK
ncbi:membrane protein insertion efficiency factor YidD [bacterium]|nr:membrane protein insertion efficiency factor YidD [candidate division CSSED10-310 bacterium]